MASTQGPERWRAIEQFYQGALERDPAERRLAKKN
jgi:hypothetical protein